MQKDFYNSLKMANARPRFCVGKSEIFQINKVTPEIELACVGIAALGFRRTETELNQTVVDHVNYGELYLAVSSGIPVAFRIIQERERGVVYLAGAVKVPGSERGLVTKMTKGLLEDRQVDLVTTRTGNDFVLDEMLDICNHVAAFNLRVNPGILSLISDIGLMQSGVHPDTLLIPNCYGGEPMLNPSCGRPESRSRRVKEFMRNILPDPAYFSGGAVILVGKELIV